MLAVTATSTISRLLMLFASVASSSSTLPKPAIVESVKTEKKFTDETKTELNAAIEAFKTQFSPSV